MAVEGVVGDVEDAAWEPFVEGWVGVVEDFVEWFEPVDGFGFFCPEFVGVLDGFFPFLSAFLSGGWWGVIWSVFFVEG